MRAFSFLAVFAAISQLSEASLPSVMKRRAARSRDHNLAPAHTTPTTVQRAERPRYVKNQIFSSWLASDESKVTDVSVEEIIQSVKNYAEGKLPDFGDLDWSHAGMARALSSKMKDDPKLGITKLAQNTGPARWSIFAAETSPTTLPPLNKRWSTSIDSRTVQKLYADRTKLKVCQTFIFFCLP